jgi:polyhydroxybutyrate depolymerase
MRPGPLEASVSRLWIRESITVIALLALACDESVAPFDGVHDFLFHVETGDTVRSAIVHVPPSYDGTRAYPLVLAFHGSGMTGEMMQTYTGLDGPADSLAFIVAYPNGARDWDIEGPKDMTFTLDLIDRLAGRLLVDRDRVYATGFSRGGSLTMRLACVETQHFAAVGVVASTMSADLAANCRPRAPIPTALEVGTVDLLVPIGGDSAAGRLSADSTIHLFAHRNGCDVASVTVTYEADVLADDRRVRREQFDGCGADGETLLYVVEGGNHAWYLGDVDTGLLLGEMFLRHRR